MTVYLNKDYEIYESDGDASIKVNCSDFMVRVQVAPDEKSQEWFGKFDFSFSFEVAEKLAQAMLSVVADHKDDS